MIRCACSALAFLLVCVLVGYGQESSQNSRVTSTSRQHLVASEGSPEWVTRMFFEVSDLRKMKPYLTGECAQYPLDSASTFNQRDSAVTITQTRIAGDSARALFSVFMRDSSSGTNYYCYLVRTDGKWRLSAIRALALTGIIHLTIQELKKQDSLPDSLTHLLTNLELVVASDSTLKAHFLRHQSIFSEIADTMLLRLRSDSIPLTERRRLEGGYVERLDHLEAYANQLLPSIYAVRVTVESSRVVFLLGGVVDNTVGYMYIPEGIEIPDIWSGYEPQSYSTDMYIYVEEIAPHWYLFKTT